jgi:hypothetical protein
MRFKMSEGSAFLLEERKDVEQMGIDPVSIDHIRWPE